jgi:hypothetical protein
MEMKPRRAGSPPPVLAGEAQWVTAVVELVAAALATDEPGAGAAATVVDVVGVSVGLVADFLGVD